jgi:cytochrome c biogenesis protein CcmG/thiol:disulfide interchange protein DsbE
MGSRVTMAFVIAGSLLAIAFVARGAAPTEKAALEFTLEDMNGAPVDLRQFAGKPLVINLWATWCGPCRVETPQLEELYQKYKGRGLTVIGVSTDDQPDAIRAFAAEYKVTYPMLVGLGQNPFLTAMGHAQELPMSILIRADGTVVERFVGMRTTEQWEKKIEGLF